MGETQIQRQTLPRRCWPLGSGGRKELFRARTNLGPAHPRAERPIPLPPPARPPHRATPPPRRHHRAKRNAERRAIQSGHARWAASPPKSQEEPTLSNAGSALPPPPLKSEKARDPLFEPTPPPAIPPAPAYAAECDKAAHHVV